MLADFKNSFENDKGLKDFKPRQNDKSLWKCHMANTCKEDFDLEILITWLDNLKKIKLNLTH